MNRTTDKGARRSLNRGGLTVWFGKDVNTLSPNRLEDVLWVFKGKSSDYKALSWKIQEPCLI